MKLFSTGLFLTVLFFARIGYAQTTYPQYYFRHPLDIPMQLVANFGEIRTNHWHMGLDIRTQQKVNLPVYAAAEGFISRVVVEPGGFGQGIYIDHPNGFTTLYAHMNAFFPALAQYVKNQQYEKESWKVSLPLPSNLFKVKKGDYIGLSGSTGASEGPHVHFEIRDTKTENCLNPLLFKFPIPDAVPPTIIRLAMYDRNKSTYEQTPQMLALKKAGAVYTITSNSVRVGSDRISFAVGAIDRFSGTPNPNGIYSGKVLLDGQPVTAFYHDDISYNDTRYLNAQLDYPSKIKGRGDLQHLSPLPGAGWVPYDAFNGEDGLIYLPDEQPHSIEIEISDANGNVSRIAFNVQYDPSLAKGYNAPAGERFLPNHLNVFERDGFELFTTEFSIYDTVPVSFSSSAFMGEGAVSPLFNFLSNAIPSHDSLTVRIKPTETVTAEQRNRMVIKNVSGSRSFLQKAAWQNGWAAARFRQFGNYQLFVDNEPPTVNAPPANLTKATRIVFTPKDNFNVIRNFRVELNGQWLRFTNDKGRTWIYAFDEKFPKGTHELKVIIEDEAGNIATKSWTVTR